MTKTIKFIDTVIRNLKPENKRIVYWCEGCPGFGMRVTPTGIKTFIYKYNKGQKRVWVTIGKYPEWSIRKARAEYDKLYEQVNDFGRDPVAEEKAEAEALEKKKTVADFLDEYLEYGKLKGKVDIETEKQSFARDVLPIIGDKYLHDVTTQDIDQIQKRILERAQKNNQQNQNYARQNGRGAIYHTLAYVRQLFNYAIKKGEITENPVFRVDSLGSIAVRDRVLSFKEIWLFWHRIEAIGLPPVTAKLFKFMLATMQRGNEVRHMTYSAYKADEGVWQMEMQDTKNRTMHRVPLNRLALDLIDEVKLFTGACPYIFGATRALKIPSKPDPNLVPYGRSVLSQALRRQHKAIGIDDFAPHDLRRTGATWITAVGLPDMYASLLLNHKEKKSDTTRRVYVQYSYDFEKLRAMQVWEFILSQIIESESEQDVPSLAEMRERVRVENLI